jgi:AcrR family transcriptional regulator
MIQASSDASAAKRMWAALMWERIVPQMGSVQAKTARGRRARSEEQAEAAPVDSTRADDAMIDMDGADGLDLSELERALAPAIEPAPRTPRQARSVRTRDGLLRAAEALFIERGYAGVTADDIADAAGVSVGAFYNYFRNKRQILMALALTRLGDIFTHLRLARMDLAHGDHHAAIHTAIASVIANGQRPGLRGVWQQLMSLEPELAPYQAIVRRYALDQLERQLQNARENGSLWPDLDIEATALAIFTMLDTLSARRDSGLPDERLVESVTTLIERALFPPGQPG